MRYDELRTTIITSSAGDWEQIPGRPLFIHELGEAGSGAGQRWVTVESHVSLAVYKPDVSLRLAWGLEEDHDLHFEGIRFPDKQIRRFYADGFWQGALVARWTALLVDGGRCYLPELGRIDVNTLESLSAGHDELITWTAKASDVAVARLLNDIVGRPEPWQMDGYMKQAGIIEIPDA